MSKPPSDATTIRTLRRELKEEHAIASQRTLERDALRGQLTKAQQEIAEWKKRFDQLMAMKTEIPL